MIAVLFLSLVVAGEPSANACLLCHPEERVQHASSVHRAEGIGCTSCHGGDATASEVAKAHARDFRGAIKRKDIPTVCATCHADIARMRPYNLPTDQLALYRTSQHGRLLEKGDEQVAVCTDCHGVHNIRRHTDPESSVFVRNIPQTCGRCHGDERLAARYGWSTNVYEEFAGGVHGKALLSKGSSTAPECSRCHGAHGAAPTGVGDVDKICGQCHTTTRAAFLEGPHKEAMDAVGQRECASCHGHHRVQRLEPAQMAAVCEKCHVRGSAEQGTGAAMAAAYQRAEGEIEGARRLVARAAAVPVFVEDYQARLEEARTLLMESLTLMHSVKAQPVNAQTERARTVAREVESEVSRKLDELRWRKVGVLVFWFYLVLTVAILLRFRRHAARQVDLEEKRG